MDRPTYDTLPPAERIEPGDIFVFHYPCEAPETNLKADKIYMAMCSGKPVMMAKARAWLEHLPGSISITSGKHVQNAMVHMNSYDLDYCKIESKGAFSNERKDL